MTGDVHAAALCGAWRGLLAAHRRDPHAPLGALSDAVLAWYAHREVLEWCRTADHAPRGGERPRLVPHPDRPGPDSEALAVERDTARRRVAAVEQLDDRARTVVLRWCHGEPLRSIGVDFGLSEATASRTLARARRELLERFPELGGER
jgi:RNA polymerase sigma factor (sigma-70 family)